MPRWALSLKQPWAALLLLGLKTIEIRRWSTPIRGPIFIHASKQRDERPEVWHLIKDEFLSLTKISGGIIGTIDVIECRLYRTLTAFTADQARHLNQPEWFQPPMYGFVCVRPQELPFRRTPGQVKFFSYDWAAAPSAAPDEKTQLPLCQSMDQD